MYLIPFIVNYYNQVALVNATCMYGTNTMQLSCQFTTTKRIEFDLPQEATIRQLMGLMTSVSAYRSYCEKFPENDLLRKVESNYELEKGRCNVEEFCYQGFIILGIKD